MPSKLQSISGTHNKRKKNGFTLIELLVVIAIIFFLAAILFPVFSRARENARRASCQSNMKQIGVGLVQYTQDYDEFYPPADATSWRTPDPSLANNYTPTMSWRHAIFPYVKSQQIFACPSSSVKSPNRWQQEFNDGAGNTQRYPTFYTANANAMGSFNTFNSDVIPYGIRKMSALSSPSTTILFADGRLKQPATANFLFGSAYCGMTNLVWHGVSGTDGAGDSTKGYYATHLGMVNIAYVDGHVKAMKAAHFGSKIWCQSH